MPERDLGIMEKKIETTIMSVYVIGYILGHIGIMENKVETTVPHSLLQPVEIDDHLKVSNTSWAHLGSPPGKNKSSLRYMTGTPMSGNPHFTRMAGNCFFAKALCSVHIACFCTIKTIN